MLPRRRRMRAFPTRRRSRRRRATWRQSWRTTTSTVRSTPIRQSTSRPELAAPHREQLRRRLRDVLQQLRRTEERDRVDAGTSVRAAADAAGEMDDCALTWKPAERERFRRLPERPSAVRPELAADDRERCRRLALSQPLREDRGAAGACVLGPLPGTALARRRTGDDRRATVRKTLDRAAADEELGRRRRIGEVAARGRGDSHREDLPHTPLLQVDREQPVARILEHRTVHAHAGCEVEAGESTERRAA